MAFVLFRVDDRLIHGQVVIGWGRPLAANRLVLVDDEVAGNGWEQELYRMAVPDGIEVVFATVAGAVAHLDAWRRDDARTLLVTGDVRAIASLHSAGPDVVHHINLGGIHHRPGRRERLPYLYLTDEEHAILSQLHQRGADVTAQDVPAAVPVGIGALG